MIRRDNLLIKINKKYSPRGLANCYRWKKRNKSNINNYHAKMVTY